MKKVGAAYLVSVFDENSCASFMGSIWNEAGVYNHTLTWNLGASGTYSDFIFNDIIREKELSGVLSNRACVL